MQGLTALRYIRRGLAKRHVKHLQVPDVFELHFLLFCRYLFYSPLLTSTFKWGGEELGHDFIGFVVGDETSRQDENIGIVVLTCQSRNLRCPAQRKRHGCLGVCSMSC